MNNTKNTKEEMNMETSKNMTNEREARILEG